MPSEGPDFCAIVQLLFLKMATPQRAARLLNALTIIVLSTQFYFTSNAQATGRTAFSLETDPAFWVGTLPNGAGIDGNLNVRLAACPRLRLGVLGYAGRWDGSLGQRLLLTDDFTGNQWSTQWNGCGVEAQYQFRFGLPRGGLQPGLRVQWNQLTYYQNDLKQGAANHLALTPQVGFQWFPWKKAGLYLLPWAGVQVPVAGTRNRLLDGLERNTRKNIVVLTAHVGWEFLF